MPRILKYVIPVGLGLLLAIASLVVSSQAAAIAAVATVLLTATLVSITWYYADETGVLRQEAQTSRLFSLPLLRLTGTLTSEPNVVLRNVGQGFAVDVDVTISELEAGKPPREGSLRIPLIGPGEGIELKPYSYPVRCINGFGLENNSIVFEARGTYVDAAGVTRRIDDEFSLSDYITRCEAMGVEFEPVAREHRDLYREEDERNFFKSVPANLQKIADKMPRF
jgi:hypothetical protein